MPEDLPYFFGPYSLMKIIHIWGLDRSFCLARSLWLVVQSQGKDPGAALADTKEASECLKFFLSDEYCRGAKKAIETEARHPWGELYSPQVVTRRWGIEEESVQTIVSSLARHHFLTAERLLREEVYRLERAVNTQPSGAGHLQEGVALQIALDVQAFHTASRTPAPTIPAFPSMDRVLLRKSLIREEAGELFKAIDDRDMVETVDGLIDLLYVTTGTLLEFGVDPTPFWNEVQASNMAKFPICKTCEGEKVVRVRGPEDAHIEKPCPDCEGRGTVLILREHDKKILKPEGWLPPDIRTILIKEGWRDDDN